jgi:hypothetical protein
MSGVTVRDKRNVGEESQGMKGREKGECAVSFGWVTNTKHEPDTASQLNVQFIPSNQRQFPAFPQNKTRRTVVPPDGKNEALWIITVNADAVKEIDFPFAPESSEKVKQ